MATNMPDFGYMAAKILENRVTRDVFSPGIKRVVAHYLDLADYETVRGRLNGLCAYRAAQAGQIEALMQIIPGMYETWKNAVVPAVFNHFNYGKQLEDLQTAYVRILAEKDLITMQKEINFWLFKAWSLWRNIRAPYGECSRPDCHNPLRAKGHALCPYHHKQQKMQTDNPDEAYAWERYAFSSSDDDPENAAKLAEQAYADKGNNSDGRKGKSKRRQQPIPIDPDDVFASTLAHREPQNARRQHQPVPF